MDKKRKIKNVHTLNARGNVMLGVARDYFKLSALQMFIEIRTLHDKTVQVLAKKDINYASLKTALVPDRKRREVALVFDITSIKSNWYGMEVFKRVIPLLDKSSNHAILVGDYSGSNKHQKVLKEAFSESVKLVRNVDYKHSSQFFIVYVNNLTPAMINQFEKYLVNWKAYVGYADTTYASLFKYLVSGILVNLCIKHKKVIIQGHEDDRSNSEDINMCGYPFEQIGYICRSLQSSIKDVLLSYKIERPVLEGFEVDTEFSLNAVTPTPFLLDDFSVEIDDAKLKYLKHHKSGSIKRAQLENVSSIELCNIVKSKISSNYIYNMAYEEQFDVTKFNIIIELQNKEIGPVRLLASLEYKAFDKTLRLVTLF